MSHKPVGILANPASGKDVRRLVARASVFDNREKSAIVRRALVGAVNAGAREFVYFSDSHQIVKSALNELGGAGSTITARVVEEARTASAEDSEYAARAMKVAGCIAVLVLGGDGTSRAFVKGWRHAILLPLSTGTNNVFPGFVEATVAGAAVGLLATGMIKADGVSSQCKIIDIEIEGEQPDIALIDAVVTTERFVGARALLTADALRMAVLTRADAAAVGMTAIGGLIHPLSPQQDAGLYLELGSGKEQVNAPIAPGLYQKVRVGRVSNLAFEEEISIKGPCILAFDGERERTLKRGQNARVKVSRTGPKVIDVEKVMKMAACKNIFRSADNTE